MRYVLLTMVAAMPGMAQPAETPELDQMLIPAVFRTTAPPAQVNLPDDPLQRIAYRAVVLNEWPESPQWKLDAYRIVLDKDIKVQGRARRTTYCPSCSGTRCADGSRVRRGICAASRNIPMHALAWLASDGLLKVTDRGGLVKVEGGCRRRGENANFDVWRPRCAGGCWTGPGTLTRVKWAKIANKW